MLEWRGIEMALKEGGPGRPSEFEVDGLPVRQFFLLELTLDDGKATVGTWQDVGEFALRAERDAVDFDGWLAHLSPADPDDRSIFREVELPGLPSDVVSRVDIVVNDRNNISEVVLAFENNREVLLVAGEAYEECDGGLHFGRNDESVLLFQDPADAKRLRWST